eukprot:3964441-Prymnesium_polylepis.1
MRNDSRKGTASRQRPVTARTSGRTARTSRSSRSSLMKKLSQSATRSPPMLAASWSGCERQYAAACSAL